MHRLHSKRQIELSTTNDASLVDDARLFVSLLMVVVVVVVAVVVVVL